MPLAERLRARLFHVCVAALALMMLSAPPATAAPLTQEQASQAAAAACKDIPQGLTAALTFLSGTAANPQAACAGLVVQSLDKDGTFTATNACSPLPLAELRQTCIDGLSPIFATASAAAQGFRSADQTLSSIIECGASMAGGGSWYTCALKSIHRSLAGMTADAWKGLSAAIVAPSAATDVIDPTSSSPAAVAFRSVYIDVVQVAALVVVAMALLSLIQGAVQRRGRPLQNAVTGVFSYGIFWAAALALAVMVLRASDGVTLFLAGADGSKLGLSVDAISKWLDQFNGVVPLSPGMGMLDAGTFQGVFFLAALGIAFLAQVIVLALRDTSIVLMAVVIPLLLALLAGPDAVRKSAGRAVAAFCAIAFAKPLMVIGLRLAAAFLNAAATDVMQAWRGVVIFVIAAFFPGVLYKLFNVAATAAGQRFSNSGAHMVEGGARGVVDTMDMASMLGASNRMGPLSAAGSAGGGAAGAGRAGGGLLGPVGMAIGLGAAAVGTGLSAVTAAASQVATGGGATGDAEGMHVSGVPRMYNAGRGGGGGPEAGPAQPAPVQAPPAAPPAAPAPSSGGTTPGSGPGSGSQVPPLPASPVPAPAPALLPAAGPGPAPTSAPPPPAAPLPPGRSFPPAPPSWP